MATFLSIVIGVVLFFGVLFFVLAPNGEKEDAAKTGAAFGCSAIASIAPFIILILVIVIIVKSCG